MGLTDTAARTVQEERCPQRLKPAAWNERKRPSKQIRSTADYRALPAETVRCYTVHGRRRRTFFAKSTSILIIAMVFGSVIVDWLLQDHHGTSMPLGPPAAGARRGSPLHSLGRIATGLRHRAVGVAICQQL